MSNEDPGLLPKCAKCGGTMAQGFIPDHSDGGIKQPSWVAGPPEIRWYGINVGGKESHTIRAYRCTGCGFLELYAPKQ